MKILLRFSQFFLITFFLIILIYPFFMSQDSLYPLATKMLLSPSVDHLFGTDSLGRDFFSRVVLGARLSFFIGLSSALIALTVGFAVGTVAGYLGGIVDSVVMRIVELLMSLPQLVTIGFVLLFFQNSVGEDDWIQVVSLIFGLGLATWMSFARMIRAQILKERNLPYVEAARAIGATPLRVLVKHIYPQIFSTLGALFLLQLPNFFLLEGFLSFVGIGVQPPMTSWGGLLNEGWKVMRYYPHLLFFPAGLLFMTIFSFQLIFYNSKFTAGRQESVSSQI